MSRLVGKEVRTESSTGAMKGVKPETFDLIPQGPIRLLAQWYGIGRVDFAEASDWRPVLNYAESHLNSFWIGENVDEATGLSPLISASAAFAHLVAREDDLSPATHGDRPSDTIDRFMDRPVEPCTSVQHLLHSQYADDPAHAGAFGPLSPAAKYASPTADYVPLRLHPHGEGYARFDLIPTAAMFALARHYGAGAAKYAAHNWAGGYEWSKAFAAMSRHLNQAKSGEYLDEEMDSPHMVAVLWHCLNLVEFQTTHPDFDDRPVRGTKHTWMTLKEECQ